MSAKVSAVMALYNTPYNMLNRTLKSILSQTFGDFELIVVDDCSTMDFKPFLKTFKDPRIKYFKLEKNSGPGFARNFGINQAQGEYIAIFDSDDIYMPDRLSMQVDFLDKNHDIGLISGKFKFSNKKKIPDVIQGSDNIKNYMLFNSALTNAAAMFRKDLFKEKNLYYSEKNNFGEDYEFWIDAMFAGVNMENIDEILMIYVRRHNQLSKTKKAEQIAVLKELYKKILSNLNVEFSKEEIDLHYQIYSKKYKNTNKEAVANWFDKIIEKNDIIHVFDAKKLEEKKNQVLLEIDIIKKRLFKLKIGNYNFCIYKPFKFVKEKRE